MTSSPHPPTAKATPPDLDTRRIAIVADPQSPKAQDALRGLRESIASSREEVKEVALGNASVIVALGGDGYVLDVLGSALNHHNQYVFAMNCGTLGFLTNRFYVEDLLARIQSAAWAKLHPLQTRVITVDGGKAEYLAFNDVALLRQTRQTSHTSVTLDGVERIPLLVGDGMLVATPAGSTAYNYSARGAVLPLDANVLAITPLNPFRPRGWRGAIINAHSVIDVTVKSPQKRPVSLVADSQEVRNISSATIARRSDIAAFLLFDQEDHLQIRILNEAFAT